LYGSLLELAALEIRPCSWPVCYWVGVLFKYFSSTFQVLFKYLPARETLCWVRLNLARSLARQQIAQQRSCWNCAGCPSRVPHGQVNASLAPRWIHATVGIYMQLQPVLYMQPQPVLCWLDGGCVCVRILGKFTVQNTACLFLLRPDLG
jgi:hypothetical protein